MLCFNTYIETDQVIEKTMNKMKSVVLGLSLATLTSVAMANTAVNHTAVTPLKTTSVKQALTQKDDTKVQLHGYVVKSLGDEKYQFQDKTGSVTVEIDNELWQGKPISAKTPVTLIGEIDIDHKPTKHVEIDVDHVKF